MRVKRIIYILTILFVITSCSRTEKVFETKHYNGNIRIIELYSDGTYEKIKHKEKESIVEKGTWEGEYTEGNSFTLLISELDGEEIQGKKQVYEVYEGRAVLEREF